MTSEQISVLYDVFTRVRSTKPDFGDRFYKRLSIDFPETMELFESVSMRAQHRQFVSMLDVILLRMMEGIPLQPLLHDLGDQHANFGVKAGDFNKFGVTLKRVMREALGEEFDENLAGAWMDVFEQITVGMRSAIAK